MRNVLSFIFLVWVSVAIAEDFDHRILENPMLAELYQRDPAKAVQALTEFDAIIASPTTSKPRGKSDLAHRVEDLIKLNPTLDLAYKRDPRRTTKLIGLILGENK